MISERCKVIMERSKEIEKIADKRYQICVKINRGLYDIRHSKKVKKHGYFWSMTKILPSGLFKFKMDGPHTWLWYKEDLVLRLRSDRPSVFDFDEEWYDLLAEEITDIKHYDECLKLLKKMDKYHIFDDDIGVGT